MFDRDMCFTPVSKYISCYLYKAQESTVLLNILVLITVQQMPMLEKTVPMVTNYFFLLIKGHSLS